MKAFSYDYTTQTLTVTGLDPAIAAGLLAQLGHFLRQQGAPAVPAPAPAAPAPSVSVAPPKAVAITPPANGATKKPLPQAEPEKPAAAPEKKEGLDLTGKGAEHNDDPVKPGELPTADGGAYDLAFIKAQTKLNPILKHLMERGVTGEAALVKVCNELKSDVAVLSRIQSLDERIPRALEGMKEEAH